MERKGFILILIGSVSLLFSALGVISLGLLSAAVERHFVAGAEWLAHAFADEVALYLRDEPRLESKALELNALVKEKVAEYLLYAQVVKDGKILAEDRSPAAGHLELQVARFPEVEQEFVRVKKRLPHGGAYLDMMKRLLREGAGAGSPSYVRLGISLASVEATVREGTLIIALTSLGGLLASILLILWLSSRIFPPIPVREGPKVPIAQVPPLKQPSANLIQVGDLCIDDKSKEVRRGEREINIKSVAGVADSPHPAIAFVVEDVGRTRTVLREGRFQFEEKEILTATLPDRPGELGRLARRLGDSGVNIESIYLLGKEGKMFNWL